MLDERIGVLALSEQDRKTEARSPYQLIVRVSLPLKIIAADPR